MLPKLKIPLLVKPSLIEPAYKLYARSIKAVIKVLKIPEPVLFCGSGSAAEMLHCLSQYGHRNVLIVTDEVLLQFDFVKALLKQLDDSGLNSVIFSDVVPDPTTQEVEKGIAVAQHHNVEAVLAIGGGSVIDTAKAIAACVANDKKVEDLVGLFKVRKQPLPLYVIPTTAGTGSEATLAAVISDAQTHQKHLIVDPKIVPKMAALDGSLMVDLPPSITAATGMDALAHAIEAYISDNATAESDQQALVAARLIFNNLTPAVQEGKEQTVRQNMALGAYYAGLAITTAGLGYVHAIAHNLGAKYGTPHGIANAMVLPVVLDYSFDAVADKLACMSKASGLVPEDTQQDVAASTLIETIRAMNEAFGIPSGVDAMKLVDIPDIASAALKEAHFTPYAVPKYLDQKRCEGLIRQLLVAS